VLQNGHALPAFDFCGLDELLMVKDGELALGLEGHRPISAPPGSNVYCLDDMAGEAQTEQHFIAPVDDTDWAWMGQDWGGKTLKIPCGQ
jgi:5-deoxy-glucuronate isomerase